jgi:hypothetical protein
MGDKLELENGNKAEKHVVTDWVAVKDAVRIYAPNISSAIFTESMKDKDILRKQIALSLVSTYVVGTSTQDIGVVLRKLIEAPELIQSKLPLSESVFIDVSLEIDQSNTFDSKHQFKIQTETRRKLHTNIIRYNIIFTIGLIGALAAASLYLSQESLALVSAAIGGAMTHLLGERTAVRSILASSAASGSE